MPNHVENHIEFNGDKQQIDAMLKKIGTEARSSIERFLDCRVNLQCWVKVKEDWRNREGLLRNFGFTEE